MNQTQTIQPNAILERAPLPFGDETTLRLQRLVLQRSTPTIRSPKRASTPLMMRAPEEILDDDLRAQVEAFLEPRNLPNVAELLLRAD